MGIDKCFYRFEQEEFQLFIVEILTHLMPRYYEKHELIFQQEYSKKEAVYLMEGNYHVGLFGQCNVNDPNKNWFKMGFHDDLHD